MSTALPDGAAYAEIVERLSYRFDGVFSRDQVTAAVATGRAELEPRATVTDYLPLLVERLAKERLLADAQADGRAAKEVPELLFVCVHNAGRSQIAAALATHLAPGKVHVRTAGSQPVGQILPTVVEALAERGITLRDAFPKPLSDSVVRAADVIVTMGCGDACPVYPGKTYEDWPVADPAEASLDEVRDIRDDIQNRVTTLLRQLGV
jgi:protein-tyrosine-phosphatase